MALGVYVARKDLPTTQSPLYERMPDEYNKNQKINLYRTARFLMVLRLFFVLTHAIPN